MVKGLPTMSFSPYGASQRADDGQQRDHHGDHQADDQPALLADPAQVRRAQDAS